MYLIIWFTNLIVMKIMHNVKSEKQATYPLC